MPTNFVFRISIFALLLCAAGCASPSEPIERKPPVAQAITDLSAIQTANTVVLTFTMPTETVDRRPLTHPLEIEIYRGVGAPGSESREHMSLLATIPSAEVSQYAAQDHIRYVDSLKPEDFSQPSGTAGASYSIRTRASVKKDSDGSNVVYVLIRPAFEPISDLKTQVTQSAIVLSWTAPEETLTGATPSVTAYEIYRGEISSAPSGASQQAKSPPLAKIGESQSPNFQDTQFEFERTYLYSVRSIVGTGVDSLESADSNLVTLTPKDTFPPAAPIGLAIAFVPQQGETPGHLELSWAISPETDVAGYNVYRSEQADVAGTRLNSDLLLTPAFRDMNVQPGHRYFYTATAVDRFGNESPRSEAASAGVPAESQPTP